MIETLSDWNTKLGYCGCCLMPICAEPLVDARSIQITVNLCGEGVTLPASYGPWTIPDCQYTSAIYKVITEDSHEHRSSQGGITLQYVTTFSRTIGNTCTQNLVETDGWDIGEVDPGNAGITLNPITRNQVAGDGTYYFDAVRTGSGAGGVTWLETWRLTYSEKITDPWGELSSAADDFLSSALADDDFSATDLDRGLNYSSETTFLNFTTCVNISPAEPRRLIRRLSNFRFRIPISHTGSYFKVTYDIAEFPHDNGIAPSYVSEDNVVEWIGPGNQEDAEGESWFTPFAAIDPPVEPGERRVVNIRYTCYHGEKFGVKPQVMGEAFEPIPP